MLERLPSWLPKGSDITANVIANAIVALVGGALAVVGAWALSWLAAPTSDRDWVNYFLISLVVLAALWLAITIGWRRLFPLPISPTIQVNQEVTREVPGARLPLNQKPVAVGVLDPTAQPLPQPKPPLSPDQKDRKLRAPSPESVTKCGYCIHSSIVPND